MDSHGAMFAPGQLIRNTLATVKIAVAKGLDGTEVDEDVFAVLAFNKAITKACAKPFYSSYAEHGSSSLLVR